MVSPIFRVFLHHILFSPHAPKIQSIIFFLYKFWKSFVFLPMRRKQKMMQENSENWGNQVFIYWNDIYFGHSDLLNIMQSGTPYCVGLLSRTMIIKFGSFCDARRSISKELWQNWCMKKFLLLPDLFCLASVFLSRAIFVPLSQRYLTLAAPDISICKVFQMRKSY